MSNYREGNSLLPVHTFAEPDESNVFLFCVFIISTSVTSAAQKYKD
jgi:hypothetical protein